MKKALFFDLDGTLADSGEGIMRCAAHALRKMGITVADYHTLRKFVGPPLEDSFKDFYQMNDTEAAQAVGYYRERFFDKGMYEIYVYPGIEDCLKRLRDEGYVMAIATSRTASSARQILNRFSLTQYFDCIGGRDENYRLHTKAEVIADTLRQLHLDAHDVIMIGDRRYDIEGAQTLHIDNIGILWGYGDKAEMEKVGAGEIIDTVGELTEHLVRLRRL